MTYTVLIIDDDLQVLNMLSADLAEEGYRVLTGHDGQMAIQMAHSQKPDLIIMDVNMPMTSGLKALESLRSSRETASIPVILLTGAQSDLVYPHVENQPRVTFIKKPVDLENINSLIRQTLEKYPKDW